ncbi:MAG: T9SS type A sorting domain-containing protein [Bacteroidales bacterium]|nr:T9SS type A sorting domain-containing protein [Bacteroidales bacterium]
MKKNLLTGIVKTLAVFFAVTVFAVTMKAQTTITLGTGTGQSGAYEASPANVYWESRHLQFVYTKAEINTAGITGTHLLKAIAFNVSEAAGNAHTNYKIRIGHTTSTNAASHISTTLTEVYTAATVNFNTTGWKTLTFTTPFSWNGVDNILVDICWGVNTAYSSTGQVYVYTPDVTNGIRTKNSISTVTCSETTDTPANKKPQAKLTFDPPTPANDNCSGATTLTVYGNTCGATVIGDIAGATSSSVTGCPGTPNNDVWYKFVALSTAHNITVVGSTGFDAVIDLRSGACNGTSIGCADATLSSGTEVINATGLTVGSTYYVRVYDYYSTTPSNTTFTICVTTPTPANNNCSSATTLTVNSGSTCANATTGNVAGATSSGTTLTCGGLSGTADVWYKFTATQTSHIITVVGSASFDAVVDLRSGSCSGTNIACADATFGGGTEVINATGLTVGSTYYVRVYNWNSTMPATTSFTICVTTPASGCTTPGAPTNLSVVPTQTGASFTWAAPNNPAGSPTIVYYWMISTSATPNWSSYIARCGDAGGFAANTAGTGSCVAPAGLPATLTPNTQYYLHMYARTSCDWTQSPWATQAFTTLSTGPANDECAGAINLTVHGGTCTNATNGDVANATQSKPAFCGGTANNDVWYKFTATSVEHIITVVGSSSFDAVVELMSGACPGTNVACADATYGGGTEVINATGLTIGNVYYVRVYDYYASNPTTTTFTICVTTPQSGVAPVANFTADVTTITVGGTVNFTDLSSNSPTTWAWQFAVGAPAGTCTPATSSLQNKPVVYNTAGTYTVKLTATNQFGSDIEEKIAYIIVNPATTTLTATATAQPTTVCQGTQTQLNAVPNGGSGTYTYAWTSNPAGFTSTSQNPSVTPNATTVYTVTVNDGSQTASTSVTVTVNPLPNTPGTINGTATVCKGSTNVSYFVSTVGNATGYLWTIPTGASIVSGQNTNSIVVDYAANAVSGNITVAGTNACGSGTASTLAITVHNAPIANAGTSQTISSGATANLSGSATGGTGSYTYSWTPANLLQNANVQNPTTLALTSSQVFTLTVLDNTTGCSGVANVQIIVSGGSLSLSATANPTTVCQGAQVSLQALPSGGSGAYTYNWSSNPLGFSSSLQNPTVSPSVSTQYIVVVSSGASSATASVAVTVNPLPDAPGNITGTPTVCQGAAGISYSIPHVNNATGYTWTLPMGAAISAGANTNSILVNFGSTSISGNISVVATNACGSSTASPNYNVAVNALPTSAGNISGPSVVSQGQTGVSYFVPIINNATNYIWSLPQGINIVSGQNTNSIVVNVTASAITGVITVYGSNNCGDGSSSPAFPVTILTDINEVDALNINVYPNPSDGKFYIEMNTRTGEKFNVKIFNTVGAIVFDEQLNDELLHPFDLGHLSNGLYYVQISSNSINKMEKLIIQK